MSSKTETPKPCAICGRTYDTPAERLTHMLVGHGPLAGASKRKRNAARKALPIIHQGLEKMGFDEVTSHHITDLVFEELRKAGAL